MYQSSRFNYKKMPFQELIFFSCILAVHVSTGIYICACYWARLPGVEGYVFNFW